MISALQASEFLRKGCKGYLAIIVDLQREGTRIEDISVVKEFSDVFPDELPGLPPERKIEFSIDLIPSVSPISKALYQMDLIELRELKK